MPEIAQGIPRKTVVAEVTPSSPTPESNVQIKNLEKLRQPASIIDNSQSLDVARLSLAEQVRGDSVSRKEIHPGFLMTDFKIHKKAIDFTGKNLKERLKTATGFTYEIQDPDGKPAMYAFQKGFKLRENINFYSDKERSHELLSIQANKIFDTNATFDVTEPATGQNIGSLQRRGLKSIFKDSWIIRDTSGEEAGRMKEKSRLGSSFFKRILGRYIPVYLLAPQRYEITDKNQEVLAEINTSRKLGLNYQMKVLSDNPSIDRRLLVSAGVLLGSIEGEQG